MAITADEINAILSEWRTRNTETYIGMRYVPVFKGVWDGTLEYEPLTIVQSDGSAYVSKAYVPVGVQLSDSTFWMPWGDFDDGVVTLETLSSEVASAYVRTFDTVAQMQASTALSAGMTCHTNGFHANGDGGAAYYTVSASGTANGMDVLALQGGLFATLVVTEPYVTPEMFGAWGDGTNDDTDAFNAAIGKYSPQNNYAFTLTLGSMKRYLITSTLMLPRYASVDGNGSALLMSESGSYTEKYLIYYNVDSSGNAINTDTYFTAKFENLHIKAPVAFTQDYNGIYLCGHAEFRRLVFNGINLCVTHTNDYVDRLTFDSIYINRRTGSDWAIYTGSQGDARYFRSIQCGAVDSSQTPDSNGSNIIHIGSQSLVATIEGCVACSMLIEARAATIRNCMFTYSRMLTVDNCDAIIEDVYFTIGRDAIPRLIAKSSLIGTTINDASLIVTNARFQWGSHDAFNYAPPIEVYNYSSITLTDVYSCMVTSTSNGQIGKSLTQLAGDSPLVAMYNANPIACNGKTLSLGCMVEFANTSTGTSVVGLPTGASNHANLPYDGESGTYYYRLVNVFEPIQKIGVAGSERSFSVDDKAKVLSRDGFTTYNMYRLYKGVQSGVYTQYVDLFLTNNKMVDNGLTLNGIPWKSVTTDEEFGLYSNSLITFDLHYDSSLRVLLDAKDLRVSSAASMPSVATYISGSTMRNTADGTSGYVDSNGTWVLS